MWHDDWQTFHDPKVFPEFLKRWRASIATGQAFEMVFPLRGKDGTYRDFLTLVMPVRNPQGRITRWFGTNTDITEQRRSEEALRRSEKLAATGRLAASIAHEINNPLEAVTNLIYLARKNPAKSERYLAMADHELERIAEITRHTLGFFRDSSTPVMLNVAEVLTDVLNLYDRKLRFKEITVRTELGEGIEIKGFPGEIRQVFSNLVANAVDAMSEGGTLRVKASKAREWPDGRRSGVRVSVMDTGSGIARQLLAKIFEPFYTTKKDVGTGLGLWLSRSLVQKHQGTIRVRSRTGSARSGTVFSIFLPQDQLEQHPHPGDISPQTEEKNP
jgi:signal transduction histidine kinase